MRRPGPRLPSHHRRRRRASGLGAALAATASALVGLLVFSGTAPADEIHPIRVAVSGPPSVRPGAEFRWTAVVTNTSATARPAHLSIGNVGIVSLASDRGSCSGFGCTFGTLPPGAQATVEVVSRDPIGQWIIVSASDTLAGDSPTIETVSYPVRVVPVGEPLDPDVRMTITGTQTMHYGDLGTYTIAVTNNDTAVARAVEVDVMVESANSLVRASRAGTPCQRITASPSFATCTIGDLSAGQRAEITVEAVADASDPFLLVDGSLRMTASGGTISRFVDRRFLTSLTREGTPTVPPGGTGGWLRLTTAGTPVSAVPADSSFSWTETVTNTGTQPTGELVLQLGAATGDLITHTNPECTPSVKTVLCRLPGLAPGASRSLTFSTTLYGTGPTTKSRFSAVRGNGAEASASWSYKAMSPGSPSADLAVSPVEQSAVSGTRSDSRTTWRVTNNGPGRALDVTMFDTVTPGSAVLIDWAGDNQSVGTIEPGESVDVRVFTLGGGSSVHHRVRVLHSGPDPDLTNNTAEAVAPAATLFVPPPPPGGGSGGGGGGGGGNGPNLALTLTADRARLAVGGQAVAHAEVRLANPTGTSGASNIALTFELPPGYALVSSRQNRGSGCRTGTTVVCDLSFLSGALVATVDIVVESTTANDSTLTASVRASEGDPDLANNTASVRFNAPEVFTPPTPVAEPTPKPVAKATQKGVTRIGGGRAETLRGTSRPDRLDGRGGADRLIGLGGADVLIGGPGRDVVEAGAGDDRVSMRDGEVDTVRCGAGTDTVVADASDLLTGCERVQRTAR